MRTSDPRLGATARSQLLRKTVRAKGELFFAVEAATRMSSPSARLAAWTRPARSIKTASPSLHLSSNFCAPVACRTRVVFWFSVVLQQLVLRPWSLILPDSPSSKSTPHPTRSQSHREHGAPTLQDGERSSGSGPANATVATDLRCSVGSNLKHASSSQQSQPARPIMPYKRCQHDREERKRKECGGSQIC